MQPVYSIKGQLKKFREIKGREKKLEVILLQELSYVQHLYYILEFY
jgi:hypothetical protein